MAQVYEDPSGAGGGQSIESNFASAVAKGLAGALGILTALVVDYIQKGDDSAMLFATRMINQAATLRLHIEAVPPYVYLVILLIAGFALVFIYQPSNKMNAFYAGAGVLGFLATFSPVAQQTLQLPATGTLPTLDSILQAIPAPAAPAPAPAAPADGGHAWNGMPGLPVVPAVY
jgi:hypothetical protein